MRKSNTTLNLGQHPGNAMSLSRPLRGNHKTLVLLAIEDIIRTHRDALRVIKVQGLKCYTDEVENAQADARRMEKSGVIESPRMGRSAPRLGRPSAMKNGAHP